MHKAIVKCNRREVEWFYNNNVSNIKYWKDEYLVYKNNKNSYSYYDRSSRYKDYWKDAILNHGVIYRTYQSGECVIWEGEVNQERLRVEDYLYIPSLNKYFEIKKVETTPNGEFTYYIDYERLFLENGEHSRLESIEGWLKNEYPTVEKYEDLKEHKDDINEYKKEYDEREEVEKQQFLNELKFTVNEDEKVQSVSCSTNNYKPKQDPNDLSWEKLIIIAAITSIVIIAAMIMIAL